ncbi:hypothetical protein [Streptomyces sp. P17]|uniref:hypothetical protein n=1 Tax=Streptomyces sp. P17 TaxID=3074716 RepID=UPI0037DCEBA2
MFRHPDSGYWGATHAGGQGLRGPREPDRIRALVIPPPWQDVWICRSETARRRAAHPRPPRSRVLEPPRRGYSASARPHRPGVQDHGLPTERHEK